ncbi:MAG: TfoX/Sxy family protein [Bacteroidota bacterium]
MAYSEDLLLFVLDQLEPFGGVSYKKMFGGIGFYKEGVMFGGIMAGELHFKVDDNSRPLFIAEGMEPFHHGPKNKPMASYYKVPARIIEDQDAMTEWAARALQAALAKKKKK